MGLTRRPDWRGRLARYLAGEMRRPFAYGTSDCALFAADTVLAMTGVDSAADWRGLYTTLRGGLRVIRGAGQTQLSLFQGLPVIPGTFVNWFVPKYNGRAFTVERV